jgi:hypothetical protein
MMIVRQFWRRWRLSLALLLLPALVVGRTFLDAQLTRDASYLILSRWLRLHYLQLCLQSSPGARKHQCFCSHSLQTSRQENDRFLNRFQYVHQTAEFLRFQGNQPGQEFNVSFDHHGTSFLTV